MENYIGKFCPFCETEITETDTVKVCPTCGIPHHETCWVENKGCTTPGCSEQHHEAQLANPTDVCTNCGTPLGDTQKFCPKCGTPKAAAPRKYFCVKCGNELQDGQKFCPKCGTPKAAAPRKNFCVKCGNELQDGEKFCPNCGQKADLEINSNVNAVNDSKITKEDLPGIEFVPTAQRTQTVAHSGAVKGKKSIFKTILVKGLLFALIGALVGIGVYELTTNKLIGYTTAARLSGHSELVEYCEYVDKANEAYTNVYDEFESWCSRNHVDPDDNYAFNDWLNGDNMSRKAEDEWQDYQDYNDKAYEAWEDVSEYEYNEDYDTLIDAMEAVNRVRFALYHAVMALFIGFFMGIGEAVYNGSKDKAVKYALIGAGVSLVIGFIGGYLRQWIYNVILPDNPEDIMIALTYGLVIAITGLGIGISVGFMKPEKKRILFCALGGLVGGFIGGFLNLYVYKFVYGIIIDSTVADNAATVIMGILIGVGICLLEQFAKPACLKANRSEFEGRE